MQSLTAAQISGTISSNLSFATNHVDGYDLGTLRVNLTKSSGYTLNENRLSVIERYKRRPILNC